MKKLVGRQQKRKVFQHRIQNGQLVLEQKEDDDDRLVYEVYQMQGKIKEWIGTCQVIEQFSGGGNERFQVKEITTGNEKLKENLKEIQKLVRICFCK